MKLISHLLITAALASCSEAINSTGTVSKRIGEVVNSPGATHLDLTAIPSFGWEYFYASKPGATRAEVCTLIKADRNVCGRIVRIERAPDDHVFLLFGKGGHLTHLELHALTNGRFDFSFGDGGYPREKAVFLIRRGAVRSGAQEVWLEPK